MGDLCDRADLETFIHSPDGIRLRLQFHEFLIGRTIRQVHFANDVSGIGIELHLDNGSTFHCQKAELDIDALRDSYPDAFESSSETSCM
ncbi:MAG: hypothetical protein AMXMBFR84_50140 [Candidatus Hydrogenedentota bacterium]